MFVHKINEDLSLKLVNIRDAEAIFALTNKNRKYLRKWLPWLDATTRLEDTQSFITSCVKGYAENKSMNVVILWKGAIVGMASFNQINWANQTAYIGYWLAEGYQGNGIMTKTVAALTEYALNELKLNKVEIRAAAENKKSRSIPERLGFTQEGTIRQGEWLYDHYVDTVVYGMLREEWQSK